MKLIIDWFNGGCWQWKYWHPLYHLWFDYGDPHPTSEAAEQYMRRERQNETTEGPGR